MQRALKISNLLAKSGMIDFLGSDIHRPIQFTAMDKIVAGLRAESDFLLQQLSSIQTPGDSSKK